MASAMDEARKLLETTRWLPLREVGRGGGGAVFLCVERLLVSWFTNYERWILNLAHNASGGGFRAVAPSPPNAEVLVERLLTAGRTGDALAAVKIPHASDGPDLARFQREVEAMRKFPHPALIRLMDCDQSNPPRWFAMQAHLAGSIDDEKHRSKFRGRPFEVLRAVRPLADALAQMHAGGAVHRDVKLKNIFVGDDNRLVLGDLGIVLPTADTTRMTGMDPVHSRDWVPDWVQFGDERDYGPEVDVFALAKVIYFLLAGNNVMASQFYKEGPILAARYPDAPGIYPTLSLLGKCIVTRRDEVTIRDGAMLLREIDDQLGAGVSVKGLAAFSFLSTNSNADCDLSQTIVPGHVNALPAVDELSSLPVHIAARTQSFIARVRAFGLGDTFSLEVRLGSAVSQRWDVRASYDRQRPGAWSDPVVLRFDRPLEPGWYDLTITGFGRSVLTGFTLIYG